MHQLHDLYNDIIATGNRRTTRSGEVISTFRKEVVFDMRDGYPAVTTKQLMFKAMTGELLWFLNGLTTLPSLRRLSGLPDDAWTIWTNDCNRWSKEWVNIEEDCGLLYGHQWRSYGYEVDQIANLITAMTSNPTSRYMRVTAWDPLAIADNDTALPACHTEFQVYVDGGHFDLDWTQRSVDSFLGLPFNIASYGLLMLILGSITGLRPRFLSGSLKDTHLYVNHLDAVKEMLSREPLGAPRVIMPEINSLKDLETLTANDFSLLGYENHGPIAAPLSVG